MADLQDLIRQHERALLNFALQLTRDEDEAEDLLQDTWIKCMSYQQLLDTMTEAKQRSWLFTVLKNRWLDICRHRKLESLLTRQIEAPKSLPQPVFQVEQHLDKLPPQEQQIIRLRFWQQLNSREIAEELGIPEGTVRWKLKQALDRLRKSMERTSIG